MSDVATRLSHALADRYRIERERGVGAMATERLGFALMPDRKVAAVTTGCGHPLCTPNREHRCAQHA